MTGVDRPVRIGVQLQPQHATYASIRQACADAEEIGVDVVFTWDHFYPLYGDRPTAPTSSAGRCSAPGPRRPRASRSAPW